MGLILRIFGDFQVTAVFAADAVARLRQSIGVAGQTFTILFFDEVKKILQLV